MGGQGGAARALAAREEAATLAGWLADFFGRDAAMHEAYARVESPEVEPLHVQNEPILWDGERLSVSRAPLWGEHTEAVLKGLLGKTDAELADLAELAAANVLC